MHDISNRDLFLEADMEMFKACKDDDQSDTRGDFSMSMDITNNTSAVDWSRLAMHTSGLKSEQKVGSSLSNRLTSTVNEPKSMGKLLTQNKSTVKEKKEKRKPK